MRLKLIHALAMLSPSFAVAQTAFVAPGMEDASLSSDSEVQTNIQLGKYWKYEITGYDYNVFGGNPTDSNSSIDGNGNYVGGTGLWNSVSASVNGRSALNSGTLYYDTIYDNHSNAGPPYQEILIKEKNVVLNFSYRGNLTGEKNLVRLHGVAIKEPPVPTGEIDVASLVRVGTSPRISWLIRREGTNGLTPAVPDSLNLSIEDLVDVPGSSPSSGGGEDLVLEFAEPTSNAPNHGKNKTQKTNNGHGNNIDGIDSSNPGKSADKWRDKWGIVDTNGGIDDEGSGGGAAPSKRNK